MDKKTKIIFALCIIIALLIGYIIGNGGSKSYADIAGGDVAVLMQIYQNALQTYKMLQDSYEMYVKIKNLGSNNLEEQISQTKILAASIGNEDLLKLTSNAEKVISMSEGDWYKLVKSKLSDLIPGLIDKIHIKKKKGNSQQEKAWVTTVDVFSGLNNKEAGIVNESHRYALMAGILDNAYKEAISNYDIPVISNGKLIKNPGTKETGSIVAFIEDRDAMIEKYEDALAKYGDKTPLQVQQQLTNQLLMFIASVQLEQLRSQVTSNRIEAIKNYMELNDQLKLKNRKQY